METKKKNSITKGNVLKVAHGLMLTKGFTATTVDEICAAAGITKGGFFHYFESKESLGKSLLDMQVEMACQAAQDAPFFKERDPLQFIYGYLDFVTEMSKRPEQRNGCLLGTFAQVLSDTHPEIRELCATSFERWAEMLKTRLDEAKEMYAPGSAIDTRSLADYFIASFEGSLILAKASCNIEIIEKNVLHFKRYVKALFEERSHKSM